MDSLKSLKKIKQEFWQDLDLGGIMAVTRELCLLTSAPMSFSSSSAREMYLSGWDP